MFVTEVIALFANLLFILYIPSAAAVPITVESKEEDTASISVFLRAVKVSGELKSSLYHLKLKPVNTAVLLASLNEKNIRVMMGIYKIPNIRQR
jgi:hypothetical protein